MRNRAYAVRDRRSRGRGVIARVAAICFCLTASIPPQASAAAGPLRVALVAASQPDDDPTLAGDAARGLRVARTGLGLKIATARVALHGNPADPAARREARDRLASALERAARSSDLVIAWGDLLTDVAIEVAPHHPGVQFVLVSDVHGRNPPPPNLTEASFDRPAQAFLAGAAAASASRSHVIGFIGAVERGPGRAEAVAYRAGALYVAPGTHVLVDFLGISIALSELAVPGLPESWREAGYAGTSEPAAHEPRKAEEVAVAQFDLGADVIYADAGASATGAYQAAAARHKWIIGRGGPDSESTLPRPWRGRVLAVVTERPAAAVYQLVARFTSRMPFPPDLTWGLGPSDELGPWPGSAVASAPAAGSVALIAVAAKQRASTGAGIIPLLAGITDQIRKQLVAIPEQQEQLRDFMGAGRLLSLDLML